MQLRRHGHLVLLHGGHVDNPLRCALLQALVRDGFRDFDDWVPNLRDGSADDLLSDAVEDAFLWNELDYLPNFLANLRNWHVDAFLWNELDYLPNFLAIL